MPTGRVQYLFSSPFAVTRYIDFWSQIQIATLVATVVFGVVATVMIALQMVAMVAFT